MANIDSQTGNQIPIGIPEGDAGSANLVEKHLGQNAVKDSTGGGHRLPPEIAKFIADKEAVRLQEVHASDAARLVEAQKGYAGVHEMPNGQTISISAEENSAKRVVTHEQAKVLIDGVSSMLKEPGTSPDFIDDFVELSAAILQHGLRKGYKLSEHSEAFLKTRAQELATAASLVDPEGRSLLDLLADISSGNATEASNKDEIRPSYDAFLFTAMRAYGSMIEEAGGQIGEGYMFEKQLRMQKTLEAVSQ